MRYYHECSLCQPLGEFGKADLYFCPQHGLPTVIARFSSAEADYTSGLELATLNADLAEAKRRAQIDGLLPESAHV